MSFCWTHKKKHAEGGGNTATASVRALPEASGIRRFHRNLLASCSLLCRYEPLSAQTATAAAFICRPATGVPKLSVIFFFFKQWRLTNDDSVVGSLVDGAVKLDDVTVAEDTEDFSLTHRNTHKEKKKTGLS